MKTHAIIPIFVPHEGCPNDCVFCNQRVITAREKAPDKAETVRIIESHLKQLGKNPGISHIEIAFYGGSFTGISMERQAEYLSIAERYKEAGRVQAIHLSTRPDYINEEILDQLTFFGTDVVELGVQSFLVRGRYFLIIFCFLFKISLWDAAYGTSFRRIRSFERESAVLADPADRLRFGKDLMVFHILNQFIVAFLMFFFDAGDLFEF